MALPSRSSGFSQGGPDLGTGDALGSKGMGETPSRLAQIKHFPCDRARPGRTGPACWFWTLPCGSKALLSLDVRASLGLGCLAQGPPA